MFFDCFHHQTAPSAPSNAFNNVSICLGVATRGGAPSFLAAPRLAKYSLINLEDSRSRTMTFSLNYFPSLAWSRSCSGAILGPLLLKFPVSIARLFHPRRRFFRVPAFRTGLLSLLPFLLPRSLSETLRRQLDRSTGDAPCSTRPPAGRVCDDARSRHGSTPCQW